LIQNKPSRDKQTQKQVAVGYYDILNRDTVVQQLKKIGATIVSTRFDAAGMVFIQYDQKVIQDASTLPFISSLSYQSINDRPLNYNSIGAHGVSGLNALNGKNLRGSGITLGMGDNADISTHTDFTGRLINRSPQNQRTMVPILQVL
jgi:hypothetical protein